MAGRQEFLFQYCQKIVVVSPEMDAVLLARRRGEADYDGVYSFIGGKMETTDQTLLAGMEREKNEEIGPNAQIRVLPDESRNFLFRKKDGNTMILPHIAALFVGGEINLNEEYCTFDWVPLGSLSDFEPKIDTIVPAAHWAAGKLALANEADFVLI